ncbi:MAG: DUF1801 domain-containing protein [Chitinophagaceae bacterium]
MLPAAYIAEQPAERQQLLTAIHDIIIKNDKTIIPVVEEMMSKEMILYKASGMMKYGLAGVKKYMSLHVLPMYMSPAIYDKYKALLPKAAFQKGCINFSSAEEMPLPVIKQLIGDCSKIDLLKIRNEQLAARKSAKQKKSK